ncbi:protein O-mannosyl-transferase TMTC2-like [Amphiura filiformis]|uniref:protein O-mannosyl-transferase TMTC2-like n=1 Tax=Amphiura filiformis TaxID=82378 RepID=UPI003B216589
MLPSDKMFHEAILCNAVVAFITYANTLSAEFTYDDSPAIVTNNNVHGKTPLSQIFFDDFWGVPVTHQGSHKSYRPLCTLSFRLNYLVGELNPFGYHLVNVLLHAIASGLVTFTANRLFERFLPTLLAGLFFALHPVHTEAVAGIVGRADVGACIFFLLSFNFYFTYCVNRESHPDRRKNAYLFLSVLCAAFSMLTKEQGITVLAVNVVFDILYQGQMSHYASYTVVFKRVISNIKGIFIQILCGLLLLALRVQVMGGTPNFAPPDNPAANSDSLLTRTLTFLYLPVFNLGLLLNPSTLCFDWGLNSIPLLESLMDIRCGYIFTLFFLAIPCTALGLNREVEIERMYMNMFGDLNQKNGKASVTNGANARQTYERVKKQRNTRRRLLTSTQHSGHHTHHPTKNDPLKDSDENDIIPHVLVIIISYSVLIFPYIPASNLFFYVGFVVAERILYIPSVGFCMLLALGFNQIYLEYTRCSHHLPDHYATKFYQIMYYGSLILIFSLYICKTHNRNYDWKSDERLFRSGINVNPTKAWNNLGSTLKRQGRLHEAELAYHQAIQHRPEWTDANYNYGVLLQEKGQYQLAIDQYKEAIKHRPNYALASLNLGYVYGLLKRPADAEKMYSYTAQLTDEHSRNPEQQLTGIISALGYLGKMQLSQGRFEEAIKTFEEALRRRPSSYEPATIYNMLGESYSKLSDYVNAENNYKKAMAHSPNNGKSHLAYAITLKEMERYADAEAYFERALVLEPHNLQVYEFFNTFLIDRGRREEAVDMLRKGLAVAPDNYHLNFYMGTNLRELGNMEEAEIYYRKIVQLFPNNHIPLRDLGAILHINGKPEESIEYYQRALKLEPDDAATLKYLKSAETKIQVKKSTEARELLDEANALHREGRNKEAEVLFRKITELLPDDKAAWRNLGAIVHTNGQPEEAEKYYHKALQISPGDEITLMNLKKAQKKIKRMKNEKTQELLDEAVSLKESGELEEAEEIYKQILHLTPEDVSAQKDLANILYLNNKLKEAEDIYVDILEKDAEDDGVKKNLAKTQNKMKIQWEEKARELSAQGTDFKEEGKLQDAEEVFKEIVKLTAEDAKAHRNLGDILRLNKKLEEAKESYMEALRLKPGDPLATQYLEETQVEIQNARGQA